jgi:hypothetical protein
MCSARQVSDLHSETSLHWDTRRKWTIHSLEPSNLNSFPKAAATLRIQSGRLPVLSSGLSSSPNPRSDVFSALNPLGKPTQVRQTLFSRIHGTEIDFVNLRSETYAEGSRIPEATFGTAEQDAFRRDLTINSLFYNIVTGEVEDLTGKGGSLGCCVGPLRVRCL